MVIGKIKAGLGLAAVLCWAHVGYGAANPELAVVCPENVAPIPKAPRSKVYEAVPYKSGEVSKYELKYGALKVLVGYGFLRVEPPQNYKVKVPDAKGKAVEEQRWHMVLHAEAYTGDWYKMIFAGHDKIQALIRPWDLGVSKFYMNQNEEKPFVRRYVSEKWLDFDHFNCKVASKEIDHAKEKTKTGDYDFQAGALDTLGAVFHLRTFEYKLNQAVRFAVYSSEKNWMLEATPVAFEKVTVNAGTFDTVKLKLQTYIGKDLQQKGDVWVWVATKLPSKPLVKIEGEVTFGSIYLLLDTYKAGK
ncbi:MAG: DUF3108 domain-containing protein [Oligoflexales bacterium]